jgi:ElaB/YqjD/DUF883 family membrane-anchored ribosome-binding protein
MSGPHGVTASSADVVLPSEPGHPGGAVKRVSWPAIFAGVVLVLAVEVLLNMLGAGVGLGLVSPNSGGTPDAASFGIGAGLWWLVSTIIALVFGCFVAARLAGVATRFDGVLHGLVIWGLALLITIYLLTSAIGGVIGGAFSTLGGTLTAAGKGITAAAPQIASAAGLTPDVVQQEAQAYLQPTNPDPATMNPQDAQKEIARLVPDLAASGDRANQAKDRIITIMAAQLNISKEEATKRFDAAQAQLTQARDRAVQTAKNVTDQSAATISRASFLAFASLFIGAVVGGVVGSLALPPAAVLRSKGRPLT